ncbi:hypothetical protein [Cronobacter dublinensis]|uniref:hypothetical protein n=1 Tax=Cronobacter dublinensis TaxID=413497 RepID=UPI000CFB0272|nr:hypothetical protein [Cronobacter dublinensis]
MMTLNEMKLRFESVKDNSKQKNDDFYNLLESKSIHFKCYDRPILSLFPYEIEFHGGKPGKEIKEQCDKSSGYYKNYFDKEGRIIIVEQLNSKEVVINRQFIFYSHDLIERYHFTRIGTFKLVSYSVLPLKKMLPEKLFNIGLKGQAIWGFIYEGDKLKKVEVLRVTEDGHENKVKDVHFLYNNDELCEIVYDYLNGEKQSIYKKLKAKSKN